MGKLLVGMFLIFIALSILTGGSLFGIVGGIIGGLIGFITALIGGVIGLFAALFGAAIGLFAAVGVAFIPIVIIGLIIIGFVKLVQAI